MPLYIRDESVNDLADRLASMMGENKTKAVRTAIEKEIEALQTSETLHDRIARIQAKAAALGIVADGHDDKDLMDDLSGGL